MSFHIHILKNNPFKFARLNAVQLNSEFLEKRVDNNVKSDEVQVYRGTRRKKLPDRSIKQTLPAVYDPVLCRPTASLSTTQTLPGLYKNEAWNAFKMSDLESVLSGSSVSQRNMTKDDLHVRGTHTYFIPTEYTTLSDSVISRENLSISLYKTEHMKNLLREMNSIKAEMDKMREENTVYSAIGGGGGVNSVDNIQPSTESKPNPEKDGPSQQQLNDLKNILMDEVPQFFQSKFRNDYYHNNITFENNFFQKKRVTHGIKFYNLEIFILKSLGRLYYSYPKMEILGMSSHVENGTVVMRWRVTGTPQLRAFAFWKFRSKKPAELVWQDGVSTFYLKDDGLVHLHKLERVLVDRGPVIEKTRGIIGTLAIALGLIPKSDLEFSGIWMKKTDPIQK